MPKLKENSLPAYRLHRQSGQAIVTLNGHDVLLGVFGSAASKAEYRRRTAEWLSIGRQLPPAPVQDATIAELMRLYKTHCDVYYRRPDGEPTGEADKIGMALKPLRLLYGPTTANEFGPVKLKAVREAMIKLGWCRGMINQAIGRVRRFVKWCVENEYLHASILQALQAVAPLKVGRCAARESEPVKPVDDDVIEATLPFLTPTVAAMVQLQRLTGARPGEICAMRVGEVDHSGEIWKYRPTQHKTAHHNIERLIHIGPKAQVVLRPFLLKLDPTAYVFSPTDSLNEMRQQRAESRKTPRSCGNVAGSNRQRKPKRKPGESYDTFSYRRAIARACDAANQWAYGGMVIGNDERIIPRWHPHQLRHSAATEIRRQFGLEAAQHVLGHASMDMAEVYAEKNADIARNVMAKIG